MTHDEKVQKVCSQVKERSKLAMPIKLVKEAVSHFVPNPYDSRKTLPRVDISPLNEILKIDPINKTCVAEPGVTFSDLVTATLKHNLIPMTVPELKTITIGGAISGCSIESMSYKYGGFHDSCTEYEVITGTGIILSCSPDKNSDVFHMIHGSYGTLGILTKIIFKLIPAKPFVHMKYMSFDKFSDFWNYMQDRIAKNDHDFVDGIIHSPKKLVVCMGKMVDKAPYLSNYEWLNIFYKSTGAKKEDYLKISEYFFRYDTECHWLTKTVPLLETKPMRLMFGKLYLGSTNLIKWSERLKSVLKLKRRPEVVVDVFIPDGKFEDFFNWYVKDFDFFPLWIVPYKAPAVYPWINSQYAKTMKGDLFIDCAIYGKKNNEKDKDYSELLERKTIELNGIKTLISRNHFNETTFWKVYNKDNYDNAKKQTDPYNLFNNLYTKFSPKNYA